MELREPPRARWFRLASAVGEAGMALTHVVPDALDGPFEVAFHLPGDAAPIRCRGRAVEEVVGAGEEEHSERRGVAFIDLDEAARARISNYVNERLTSP